MPVEQYADQVADCDALRGQVQAIRTGLREKSAFVATLETTLGLKADQAAALLELFPLAGAVLPIRREVLIRGQCIVGLWVLCLLPVLVIAPSLGVAMRVGPARLPVVAPWNPASWIDPCLSSDVLWREY